MGMTCVYLTISYFGEGVEWESVQRVYEKLVDMEIEKVCVAAHTSTTTNS